MMRAPLEVADVFRDGEAIGTVAKTSIGSGNVGPLTMLPTWMMLAVTVVHSQGVDLVSILHGTPDFMR